jgi:hypothetical protein
MAGRGSRGFGGALAIAAAALALALWPAAWAQDAAAEEEPEDTAFRFVFFNTDYVAQNILEKADILSAQGRWERAFELYEFVLSKQSDALYRVNNYLYRGITSHCLARLAEAPPEFIERRRLETEVEATRALAEALAAAAPDRLMDVRNRYFATTAAARALETAGDLWMDRGNSELAVGAYRSRVEGEKVWGRAPARVYVKGAEARAAMSGGGAARRALEAAAGAPGDDLEIAGTKVDRNDYVRDLAARIAEAAEVVESPGDWPEIGGRPDRGRVSTVRLSSDVKLYDFEIPGQSPAPKGQCPADDRQPLRRADPPADGPAFLSRGEVETRVSIDRGHGLRPRPGCGHPRLETKRERQVGQPRPGPEGWRERPDGRAGGDGDPPGLCVGSSDLDWAFRADRQGRLRLRVSSRGRWGRPARVLPGRERRAGLAAQCEGEGL